MLSKQTLESRFEDRSIFENSESLELNPMLIGIKEGSIQPIARKGVFQGLKESIRSIGILNPIVVMENVGEDQAASPYVLVAGAKRLLAAQDLSLSAIPCLLVKPIDDEHSRLIRLVENHNRKNLISLEVSQEISVQQKTGLSLDEIARTNGMSKKTVQILIRIADWPKSIKQIAKKHESKLGARGLFALASKKLSDEELLREITKKVFSTKEPKSAKIGYFRNKAEHFFNEESCSLRQKKLIIAFIESLVV